MTELEALKEIQENGVALGAGGFVDIEALKVSAKALEEIQQYRALGTAEELQEAMEKQTPKNPFLDKLHHQGYYCPECEEYIWDNTGKNICDRCGCETPIMPPEHIRPSYCRWCGQAIDWSEEE